MAKIETYDVWNSIPAYTGGGEQLDTGGHYLQILGAELASGVGKNGPWQAVRIAFDCHSTDSQAGYFTDRYNRSKDYSPDAKWPNAGTGMVFIPAKDADDRAVGRWNGFVKMLNDSNPSKPAWDRDTDTLKNMLIGGVFREEEYDFEGRQGFTVKLAWFCSTDAVPDAKTPKPRLLNKPAASAVVESKHDLPFDF